MSALKCERSGKKRRRCARRKSVTKLQGTVIELRQEERKVKNNERTDKEWTLSELSVLTNNVEVLKDGMTEVNETKS
jgi:hypothetical protein